MGVAHNGLEGTLGKERPSRQGHLGYALADIRQALCLGQGHDRGADADALCHAAEGPAPQVLPQLRLADQHNLQEGLPRGDQVRKQRQLLEGLDGQVLRLIDDERHRPALVGLVPEALLQLGQQGLGIVRCLWHREMASDEGE
jgi:hypothetical protein